MHCKGSIGDFFIFSIRFIIQWIVPINCKSSYNLEPCPVGIVGLAFVMRLSVSLPSLCIFISAILA